MMNEKTFKTTKQIEEEKNEAFNKNVNVWLAYYRANPHRFVQEYMNINLKWFQQVIIYAMFLFPNFIYLACRGIGKTFLMAIFSCAYCILYPGTSVKIASKTRKQGAEVIKKITSILIPKSTYLEKEISEYRTSQTEIIVTFHNGSDIEVVTAGENARGNRATILIIDEFRMVDYEIINSILKKFLATPRMPGFLSNPKYSNYPLERNRVLYASSCWYESHWSYDLVLDYIRNMFNGGSEGSHFCCSMPYQLAIKEGMLDAERIAEDMAETNFSEMKFLMEMEGLFYGNGSGGFFSFPDLEKNRKIRYPIFPRSAGIKLAEKGFIIPQKQPYEKRILSVDVALMASKQYKNDAASIMLNQMLITPSGKYKHNITYSTNCENIRTDELALMVRHLFDEFACDYLVIDGRGNGLGVVDALLTNITDPETQAVYGALSCCNKPEIAERCHVKGAPKALWVIHATSELNSACAFILRDEFRKGNIALLNSENDAEGYLTDIKGYLDLSIADQLKIKLPYIDASLLVEELIGLECEPKNGIVKLKEKSGERKDRYSSLSYNIYVAKEIEKEYLAKKAKKNGAGIFLKFNAPKLK